MLSQQLDLLDGFIQISDQGTSQLHLISEASHAIVTSSRQYHSFRSFFSSAQEVAVLRMHHLLIHLMSQDSQCFTSCLSHACLERPPQCRSLDHLADVVDTIGRSLSQITTCTHQRYEFPRSSLGVPMKSGGSLEPSARSMVRRVLEK
jgi:hypothetical protein